MEKLIIDNCRGECDNFIVGCIYNHMKKRDFPVVKTTFAQIDGTNISFYISSQEDKSHNEIDALIVFDDKGIFKEDYDVYKSTDVKYYFSKIGIEGLVIYINENKTYYISQWSAI